MKLWRNCVTAGIMVIVLLLAGCSKKAEETVVTEAPEKVWSVTQFNALYDELQTFYTIMDGSGKLIVIDGGISDNEEIVRRVIEEYGGKVSAWILTTPDAKHIGAFLRLYENPGNIVIDKVYDAFIDRQRYEDYATRESAATYNEYLDVTKDDERIVHVNRDAKFFACGLTFECFNAYDSYVEQYSADLNQDGSLMLKISGDKQSMLFCGDITSAMESFLTEEYSDRLASDYVIMSNHGNNGLSVDFYKLVSPSVAFFDGKEAIYNQEEAAEGHRYSDYKAYFTEQGVTMYDLSTAPNIIELR